MATLCTNCGHHNKPDRSFCTQCGTRLTEPLPPAEPDAPPAAGPGTVACPSCGEGVPVGKRFCTHCGTPLPRQGEAVPAPAPQTAEAPAPQGGGRPHSPVLALILAFLIPGAGQAYNGCPFRAVLFLLTSVLVLPWIGSLVDAYLVARRLVREGGRFGRGGFAWVFLQGWLAFDAALFVLIVLTIQGVVR